MSRRYQLTDGDDVLLHLKDGNVAVIPADIRNTDRQDYEKWRHDGNEAEPARTRRRRR